MKRWRAIALSASLGAAAGALLLYLGIVHLGYRALIEVFPQIASSSGWIDAKAWLNQYGVAALFLVTALPVPLTPALLFAGLAKLPWWEVALALWMGRLLKFYVYAWATAQGVRWWSQMSNPMFKGKQNPKDPKG
uniref:VTT domain-containing protein n=1 Tax=Rhodoferax sp. GW822-FHT02A01 TaxID=3141537 RepID=UPI00406C2043